MEHNIKHFGTCKAQSFYYPAKNVEMAFANEAYFMSIYGGAESIFKNLDKISGYERKLILKIKINSQGLKTLFY